MLQINSKNRKIALFFFLGLLGLAILIGFLKYNFKLNKLNQAKQYLKEYKVSKALELLSKTRSSVDKADKDLDFLIFYSYIKSYEFEKAAKILADIKEIPRGYEKYFFDLIDVLNINDEAEILVNVLEKAHHFKLKQNFFIDYSQARKNLKDELALLEGGLRYLNVVKSPSNDLKDYLLKRYIEISEIFLGKDDGKQALEYLKRADTNGLVKGSAKEDIVYLNKALAYKSIKDYENAWNYLKLSEDLGNEIAKKMLFDMNNRE